MRILTSVFLITIILVGLYSANVKAQDKPIQIALV